MSNDQTKKLSAGTEIHVTSDLESFFKDQVVTIARKQGTEISPLASQYLGSVLKRFTDARNYLVRQVDANKPDQERHSFPTLALLFLETNETPAAEQFFKLLHVGDVALFTSGYFGERVLKNNLDMDYYRAMGGMAYERAGKIKESIAAERDLNVYFELAESFERFVEVFAEMSDQPLLANSEGILKLYEKWLARQPQGSFRLTRMLNEAGVIAGSSGQTNDG